ncbi:hypothetical protein OHS18_28030 [Amycolatopsis sp. NBC_00355]|uniref:hypothetical protein n=1 Tax=Amycolatopsis sp. NBC_00355 TaxID=2975957 RepID=UPI002E264E76
MSTPEELTAGLASLVRARVTDFSRTLNMAEVGFLRDGVVWRLHAQCPFRVRQGDRILVGTVDMNYPVDPEADRMAAFDQYAMMFDRNAKKLTALFQQTASFVDSAVLGPAGIVTLALSESVVIEVMPASAGLRVEQWRIFERGSDTHYVFPDSADR